MYGWQRICNRPGIAGVHRLRYPTVSLIQNSNTKNNSIGRTKTRQKTIHK